jgi:hypothetical protein
MMSSSTASIRHEKLMQWFLFGNGQKKAGIVKDFPPYDAELLRELTAELAVCRQLPIARDGYWRGLLRFR